MSPEIDLHPLTGIKITTLAVNIPGPVAAARLRELGATVVKVEPPGGDPLIRLSPTWYQALAREQKVVRLNLKDRDERAQLDQFLEASDLLITSTRNSALNRLSLGWLQIHTKFPGLSQVAIVGHAPPNEELAGHDVNYQAELGLITPPHLPRTVIADLAGAERVVSAATTLLLARERDGVSRHTFVSLVEAARTFAEPTRYGLTTHSLFATSTYHSICGFIPLAKFLCLLAS